MKRIHGLRYFLSAVLFFFSAIITACSNIVSLDNPPAGLVFTNTSGEIKSLADDGAVIQLRVEETSQIIAEFQVGGDVDFSNVTVEWDIDNFHIVFASEEDKSGIEGDISLFIPCSPDQNAVRVCPESTELEDTNSDCVNAVVLTADESASDSYTFLNTDRAGTDACQLAISSTVLNVAARGTDNVPYSFSLQNPGAPEGSAPLRCTIQCDDPVLNIGGFDMSYACDFTDGVDDIIEGPIDTLEGFSFSCELNGSDIPDNFSRYFDTHPNYNVSYVDSENATIDINHYNFLLSDEEADTVLCEYVCEAPEAGEGTIDYDFDGNDKANEITITGYDTDNIYFLNPLDIPEEADGGELGDDTLVITDADADESFDFALGAGDFVSIVGFENIDLDNDVTNGVSLDEASVLAFSDTDTLIILGDESDTVTLSDAPWTVTNESVTIDDRNYVELSSGDAVVFVEEVITLGNE